MRTIVSTAPGVLELNFTWLPTWIGSNAQLQKKLSKELDGKFIGRPLTEQTLDEINDEVIAYLVEEFPQIEGLGDYLDGLKFVKLCPEPTACTSG